MPDYAVFLTAHRSSEAYTGFVSITADTARSAGKEVVARAKTSRRDPDEVSVELVLPLEHAQHAVDEDGHAFEIKTADLLYGPVPVKAPARSLRP